MKKARVIITMILFLGCLPSHSQTQEINGNIITFKGYPLNKVEVSSKKSKKIVLSDSLGNFSIECSKKDVLRFTAAGFEELIVKIKKQEVLEINMIFIQGQSNFNDAVEAEHISAQNLEFCVNNLQEDNNNFDKFQSVFDVIQYIYPAAKVTSVTTDNNNPSAAGGNFGTSGKQILLNGKGTNTILSSPYALLVVDGIVTIDISGVAPMQIKSIKVLTSENAGHWGTRGANGVVEITLKTR
jgi:hypothetical protein